MSVIINKNDSNEAIRKALRKVKDKKSRKKIALEKYFGKIPFDENGLTFQKRVRNEWK